MFWDVAARKQLSSPLHIRSRGPVTCVAWVDCHHNRDEIICYTTGLGYICFVRHVGPEVREPDDLSGKPRLTVHQKHFEEIFAKRVGTGGEITCLAWDASSETAIRIATGTRDRLVQVWTFESRVRLHSVFSIQLDVTVPQALGFDDNKARDVFVFGRVDGYL
jgi:WD40 repeat protein